MGAWPLLHGEHHMAKTSLPIRRLGRTSIRPTALSMGGAWIGTRNDSDREAIEAVHRAFQRGINFFDTAPLYDEGKAERRLGRALRDLPRASYYLSTKVGTRSGMRGNFTPEAVQRSFEQSLTALGVDYVDLLLIHDPPNIETALADALEPMLQLKEQGLARHIGIGCRPHAFHHRAMATGQMDAVLTFRDYTLLNQSATHDTIPEAVERGVGLLLASPLDMGTLTGMEPDAPRHPRAHAIWQWCAQHGVDLRGLALQFCLALPIDGCVLVGPATAQEVDEAIDSATMPIDEATWTDFETTFGIRRYTRRDAFPPSSAAEPT